MNITHVLPYIIPINGTSELFFFIEKDGKILWCKNKKEVPVESLQKWILEKRVFKVEGVLRVDEDDILLVGGSESNVYIYNTKTDKSEFFCKFNDLLEIK